MPDYSRRPFSFIMELMNVTKAILPVAGQGIRLMPITFHQPKGMITVADRPMIHYIIDELVSAGIKHIIIVTSPDQDQFKKYIDYLHQDPEWKKLNIRFDFVIQKELRGNADALLPAQQLIGQDPFLVYFGDDLLLDKISPTKSFIKHFQKFQSPILSLKKVPKKLISGFGIVKAKKIGDVYKIMDIVEKPKIEDAPSDMGAMGRYLLTPEIFSYIQKAKELWSAKREIAVVDVLSLYLKDKKPIYGWLFKGMHFDGGSKIGLLKANAYFSLHHPEYKKEMRQFVKQILK